MGTAKSPQPAATGQSLRPGLHATSTPRGASVPLPRQQAWICSSRSSRQAQLCPNTRSSPRRSLCQHANGQTQRAGSWLSPDTVQPRQTSFIVYNVWIYAVCTHCSPPAGHLPALAVLSHRCSKMGQKSLLKIHTCVFHCPSANTERGLRTDCRHPSPSCPQT